MYPSIAFALSAAALISASPISPLRQRQIQHLQNNLNPNLLSDPIEAKSDHRLYAGSIASNFRPEADSDEPYVRDAKRGEVRAGAAKTDDDVPDQNQIMNEISNIIKENNMKVMNIKSGGSVPALSDDVRQPKAPMDLAVPLVNEQDPNNKEQFEQLPRINERIPVANGGMFRGPNMHRAPIVNDHEGIVYHEPKVHERIPTRNEIKLNDLEDANNVDAVINKLDSSMKAKVGASGRLVQNHGDVIHHHEHQHHLHRGADMGDTSSELLPNHQNMKKDHLENHRKPSMKKNAELEPSGKHRKRLQNQHGHENQIHNMQEKHYAEKIGAQRNQMKTKQSLRNQLQRIRRNYLYRNAKLPQNILAAYQTRGKISNHARRLHPFAENIGRHSRSRNRALGTMEKRIHALEQNDRIDNRIYALEMEVSPNKHRLPLKKILQVAPQKVKLSDLENENNVKDVISALDNELPQPIAAQENEHIDARAVLNKLNEISALLKKEHIPIGSEENGNKFNEQTDLKMRKNSVSAKQEGPRTILGHPRDHGNNLEHGMSLNLFGCLN